MLLDVNLAISDAKLSDLFDDLLSMDKNIELASDLLYNIVDKGEHASEDDIDKLFFVLNSLQRYFIDIKPMIEKYYYFQYNFEKNKQPSAVMDFKPPVA